MCNMTVFKCQHKLAVYKLLLNFVRYPWIIIRVDFRLYLPVCEIAPTHITIVANNFRNKNLKHSYLSAYVLINKSIDLLHYISWVMYLKTASIAQKSETLIILINRDEYKYIIGCIHRHVFAPMHPDIVSNNFNTNL